MRIKKWEKKNMSSENFDHARTNIFIYVFRLVRMFSAAVFLRYVNSARHVRKDITILDEKKLKLYCED